MGFFKNSPKNKEEYISDLAHAIFNAANDCNEVILPAVKELKMSEKEKVSIYTDTQIQYQYFFVHLVDREVLSLLGDEKRIEIVASILNKCMNLTYSEFYLPGEEDRKNNFFNKFIKDFDEVQVIYSKYNSLMNKEYPLKQDNFLGILVHIIALKLYGDNVTDVKLFKFDYSHNIFQSVIETYGRYKLSKKINEAEKLF